LEISTSGTEAVFQKLQTSKDGLPQKEGERRLKEYGPNVVAQDQRHSRLRLLGRALINPLVILLSILALVAVLNADLGLQR
jgi:P-type Mg2+ transporter